MLTSLVDANTLIQTKTLPQSTLNKWQVLTARLASLGSAAVAYSGGVDSTLLAYAAFLDWLCGLNGLSLLSGQFSKTLELNQDEHLRQLSTAGQLGLMRIALAGGVLQLDFSDWLRPGESRLPAPTTDQH